MKFQSFKVIAELRFVLNLWICTFSDRSLDGLELFAYQLLDRPPGRVETQWEFRHSFLQERKSRIRKSLTTEYRVGVKYVLNFQHEYEYGSGDFFYKNFLV